MRKPPGIYGRAAWRMSCRLNLFGSLARAIEYSGQLSGRKFKHMRWKVLNSFVSQRS
jgi:hypothetical protein